MNYLDSRYFQHLRSSSKTVGNTCYQAYRPLGNPIILFSLITGEPLASLHFRAQNRTSDAKALFVRRPAKLTDINCNFQGIINKDCQEIELVISNLTDSGFINFNILKTNEAVTTVNPGGLNEINELRPGTSYAVQCDQTNNRTLILKTLTKDGGSGEEITIKEAESDTTNRKGTFFYLSVVPEISNQQLCNKFVRTKWSVTDVFYRKVNNVREVFEEEDSDDEEELHYGDDIFGNFYCTVASIGTRGGPKLQNNSMMRRQKKCARSNPTKGYPTKCYRTKSLTNDTLLFSKATAIEYGRQISVDSVETGIEYDYDKASEPCVICLSVNTDIEIDDSVVCLEEIKRQVEDLIEDAIENESKQLLETLTKIFKEDNCCVCLDPEPNVCLFCCGHQCLHKDCATEIPNNRCPLCRHTVTAKISV